MRVYRDFREARNEIERDLAELGKLVFAGYQSKDLADLDQDALTTRELTDYDYRVLKPSLEDLREFLPSEEWLKAEWDDRLQGIYGKPVNPGTSWEKRPEVWTPLLERVSMGLDPYHTGQPNVERFSYTYSERLAAGEQCIRAAMALTQNPHSRQAYVSVWNPQIDAQRLGTRRVPCSLGYQITVRRHAVNMHYTMRSNDFHTHWANDVTLAVLLQVWFQDMLNNNLPEGMDMPYQLGSFTHSVGSLHVYARDVAHVF